MNLDPVYHAALVAAKAALEVAERERDALLKQSAELHEQCLRFLRVILAISHYIGEPCEDAERLFHELVTKERSSRRTKPT